MVALGCDMASKVTRQALFCIAQLHREHRCPFGFVPMGLLFFLIGIALGTFVYGCAHLGFGFKQNHGFILDCEDVGLVCGFGDLI